MASQDLKTFMAALKTYIETNATNLSSVKYKDNVMEALSTSENIPANDLPCCIITLDGATVDHNTTQLQYDEWDMTFFVVGGSNTSNDFADFCDVMDQLNDVIMAGNSDSDLLATMISIIITRKHGISTVFGRLAGMIECKAQLVREYTF